MSILPARSSLVQLAKVMRCSLPCLTVLSCFLQSFELDTTPQVNWTFSCEMRKKTEFIIHCQTCALSLPLLAKGRYPVPIHSASTLSKCHFNSRHELGYIPMSYLSFWYSSPNRMLFYWVHKSLVRRQYITIITGLRGWYHSLSMILLPRRRCHLHEEGWPMLVIEEVWSAFHQVRP